MRFGSVDNFIEQTDWGFRMGRPVANESFLRALLRHGSWDAYHFFCPDSAGVRRFSEKVVELVPDPALRSRVFASPHAHLPSFLEQQDFDVFHQGDFTYFQPHLATLRAARARRPFPISGITHSLDGAIMQLRYLQLAIAGLAPCDGVVCTSEAARVNVEARFAEVEAHLAAAGARMPIPARTTIIPLGIEDELFDDVDSAEGRAAVRREARAFFRIPDDVTLALSVGRLSLRQKSDWAPVLELMARMDQRGELDKFVLIIAGGGDDYAQLLQSIVDSHRLQPRVILFPNFPPEAKARLYRAADIYVSLIDNYQETFGLNVIEAMAAGLPVIASDFDGYRDSVVEGETGHLVPTWSSTELPGFLADSLGILDTSMVRLYLSQMVAVDLDCFRERLLSLKASPEARVRLGLAGRQRAARYHWKRVIADYEAFWIELGRHRDEARSARRGDAALLTGEGIRAFGHFPARRLDAASTARLTDAGRAAGAVAAFTRYEDMSAILSRELEALLLRELQRGPRPLAGLREAGRKALDASDGDVDFHVLWLAKHGAIALA